MALADIRLGVVAALEAVSNIGVVNDLDPFNFQPGEFEDAFEDRARGEIRGWAVGLRESRGTQHVGTFERVYEIRLVGLLGRREGPRSREQADNLLEAVLTKFFGTASNRRLPSSGTGTVDWTETAETTVEDYLIRTSAGDVPGHRIVITFTAVKETALA